MTTKFITKRMQNFEYKIYWLTWKDSSLEPWQMNRRLQSITEKSNCCLVFIGKNKITYTVWTIRSSIHFQSLFYLNKLKHYISLIPALSSLQKITSKRMLIGLVHVELQPANELELELASSDLIYMPCRIIVEYNWIIELRLYKFDY